MPDKVKILKAIDNDTFKVQLKDGSVKNVRLVSGNNQAWYDGFEKGQPGFKLDEAVSSLVGKEVDINFKKLSSKETEYNSGRELGSVSTATIPDLAEHLYSKGQVYKRDIGSNWKLGINEEQKDSLMTPQQYKATQSLLIKKEQGLNPKKVLAYKREINSAKQKFGFISDKELVDFVGRRSSIPYESLKTFQTNTSQPIMETQTQGKTLKATPYNGKTKTYQKINIEQANALIDGDKIKGTNVDELKSQLEQTGAIKDLVHYELHENNGVKYLFPVFKGNSSQQFNQALKTNEGDYLNAFGNKYATSDSAIKEWKDQFGVGAKYDNTQENKLKLDSGVPDATLFSGNLEAPKRNVTGYNTEINSRFLTNSQSKKPVENTSEFIVEEDNGSKVDGYKLASSLFLNLAAGFNPEPFTSGAMNTSGNLLYREATNTKFTDAPIINTLDELLGYSGAIGYLGATAPVGAALEAGSTAMSAAKIAKITTKMSSLLKNAKNNKALTGSITAAALSLGGKGAYDAVVSAKDKYGIGTSDFWKEVGVSVVPLIIGGFNAKKRFREGKASGLEFQKSMTPVIPSVKNIETKLLQSPVKNATNWTTNSGKAFKQGGTLKFQNGQALPYNSYQSVTNPVYGVNSFLGSRNPVNQNIQGNLKMYSTQAVYNQQKNLNNRFNAGLVLDGTWGTNTSNAQRMATIHDSTPNLPSSNPPTINEKLVPIRSAVAYNNVDSPDSYRAEVWDNTPKPVRNTPEFGYQEANLALSVLPMLLNQKVKADKLSYQPYNPEIRGIQGDPLLQQRLTSIAQNKYLQNKATSSDPTQELARRLIVNRQAMQGNQDAYNIDTQARIADTQRYYGERNAASQFNYTNKQNTDNQNIQMNNNAMMQNAAQKNQVTGQTIQNIMGYMTNKANDQNLVSQNYLAHKNIERQGLLNNLTPKYAAMYNSLEASGLKRTDPQYIARAAEIDNLFRQESSKVLSYGNVNDTYSPHERQLRNAGYWQPSFKKGGTISEETKVLQIVTTKATNLDKVFIDSARKYNELSSKVSTSALDRGSRLVVNALNNLPKTTLKSLPFKKIF